MRRASKYYLDDYFFSDIDSEAKAYWLGFLMADGCIQITENRKSLLAVELSQIDSGHLQKFLDDLSSDHPVYLYTRTRNGRKEEHSARIMLYSDRLVDDLVRNGMALGKINRKSFPKTIPEDLIRHFLRGNMDGDGSIFNSTRKKSGRTTWSLVFLGQKSFVTKIRKIISSHLGVSRGSITPPNSRTRLFVLNFTGNIAVPAIANWLYKDATVFLERKGSHFRSIGSDDAERELNERMNYKSESVSVR